MSESLWEMLGVRPGCSRAEVDTAWAARRACGEGGGQVRIAAKVLRDPFYAATYAHYRCMDVVYAAGFFDDGAPVGGPAAGDTQLLGTPVGKLVDQLRVLPAGDTRRRVVLVSTGAFSPIHQAHLAMMEAARVRLEADGLAVVGGYLSPSHDVYVSTKYGGAAALPAEQRIALTQQATAGSDWLMTDPWEARYVTTSVNFTDVVAHLRDYLSAHVDDTIEVMYVCGADNAGFVRAFLDDGGVVCVPRPGGSGDTGWDQARADPLVDASPRIWFADHHIASNVSSTAVRAGTVTLPVELAAAYSQMRSGPARAATGVYAVRDDVAWAISGWAGAGRDAADQFTTGLLALLASCVLPAGEVALLDVEVQRAYVAELETTGPVLSLDPVVRAGANLATSRLFHLSCGQRQARGLIARPGAAGLGEQLAALPAGRYTLVDDDVATGTTMAGAAAMLPARVRIGQVRTLLAASLGSVAAAAAVRDVVDARDFLPGARDAGLVVQLPDGSIGRAAYLLPYVNPVSRANISAVRAVEFSAAGWELAAGFFDQIDENVSVADIDPAAGRVLRAAGFGGGEPMAQVCRRHAELLRCPAFPGR